MLLTIDKILGDINRLNNNLEHMTHGDAFDPMINLLDRCQGFLISLFYSPSWVTAPDWATFLVLNSTNNGLFWEWHEHKPEFLEDKWVSGGKTLLVDPFNVGYLCRVSIEQREDDEEDD